jgi:hypothetical protein
MAQFLKHCTLPSSQERSLNSESMFPISKTMFSERTVARRQDTRRSCANLRFEAEIFSSTMSHGRSAEVARKECEHNIDGYHIRNYQPGRIPALSSFLGELTDLPILVLEGCARWPRLRICHGCHDVFKYNVASQIFPQLTEFGVTNMFIRGGPLRTFISRHSSTLKSVGFDQVFLTDGSWKSVADGLSRHCSLESILINLVYQRSPAPALSRKKARRAPEKTSIFCEEIYGREEVDRFLAKFMRYFRTKKYKRSRPPPRRPRPVYHRVVLFELEK